MTVESIMYMGIGFLFAGLIGVAVIPLIHGRAVRLATRRLEATPPQLNAKTQADKDLLRAKFAMSVRRLEMTIEQLKNKTTGQLAELGKKSDIINRLKIEREALNIEVIALKGQIEAEAYSTKMAEASLVPVAPTIRQANEEGTWTRNESADQSMQEDTRASDTSLVPTIIQSSEEDTWTRDDSTSDTSLVPTIGQSDTWVRNRSADQSTQEDMRMSDASRVIGPFTGEQDTWERDKSPGVGPMDQLYPANRLAKAHFPHSRDG